MTEVWLPPTGKNPVITGIFVDHVDQSGRKRLLLKSKSIGSPEISTRIVNDDPEGARLKFEFSAAWEEYLRRNDVNITEALAEGAGSETSIAELELPRSTEARLRQNGFTLVEQVAHMPDAQADGFDIRDWRQRARDFLAAKVARPDPHHALTQEIASLKKRLKALQADNDKLRAKLATIEAERDVPVGFRR